MCLHVTQALHCSLEYKSNQRHVVVLQSVFPFLTVAVFSALGCALAGWVSHSAFVSVQSQIVLSLIVAMNGLMAVCI